MLSVFGCNFPFVFAKKLASFFLPVVESARAPWERLCLLGIAPRVLPFNDRVLNILRKASSGRSFVFKGGSLGVGDMDAVPADFQTAVEKGVSVRLD